MNKVFAVLMLVYLISACTGTGSVIEAVDTATPAFTEIPMAIKVNGEGISLSEYEAELLRYAAAIEKRGEVIDPQIQHEIVQDELINQLLLAQEAANQSYFVDEASLEQRIDQITAEMGGNEKMAEWMNQNLYDEQSLKTALARNIAAAWMRDQIINAVADTADQVHARQILVQEEGTAVSVERQIQAGTDFETLAFTYDPLTGGDLGWFPRGYLFQPAVEEAAFNLQAGGVSGIIQTEYGFHLIQVIERDNNRLLTPDAKLFMQHQALEQWLEQKKSESTIGIFI